MSLRVWLLNGNNKNQDYDFGFLLQSILNWGWYFVGLEVQPSKVTAWMWFIPCVRLNWNKPFVFVEMTADEVIDTTWTKKVWIEVDSATIEDWSGSADDWTWIASIQTGANYPAKNYIPLASITAWVITDERVLLWIQKSMIDLDWITTKISTTMDIHSDWDIDCVWDMTATEFYTNTGGLQAQINWINTWLNPTVTLWETIWNNKIVALLPDNKAYQMKNNMRTLTWAVAWETATKSCILPWDKIATVGRTWNTLTLYIGTIDRQAKTITYWLGVQVTTNNADWQFFICKAWVDSCCVSYGTAWQGFHAYGITAARAISIVWTVPAIGSEVSLASDWTYGATAGSSCYVAPWKVAIWVQIQSNWSTQCFANVCWIYWTTLTPWGGAWGTWWNFWTANIDMQYLADDVFAYTRYNNTNVYLQVLTVALLVPTAWAYEVVWNNVPDWWKIASDWTIIYTTWKVSWWAVHYMNRFTYFWNTLTNTFNTQLSIPDWAWLVMNWKVVWYTSGTTIVRCSDDWTKMITRNTINYWVSLAQLRMDSIQSQNYNFVALTTNPSTVYMIANESRNIVWYLPTWWNNWDSKSVIMNWGTITGLSNIIPWEMYYLKFLDWSIGLTWDIAFWKWISTTAIRVSIDFVA